MINADILEKEMIDRIIQLRSSANTSARNMSLSMGQGPAYINKIENGNSKPSLKGLLLICEYFNITPKEFFDMENKEPNVLNEVVTDLKRLSPEQLINISKVIKDLIR